MPPQPPQRPPPSSSSSYLRCDEGEVWLRYASPESLMTAEHVARFERDGYVVVEGVFTAAEVARARRGFLESLRSYGAGELESEAELASLGKLSSTRGAGGVLDLFYEPWKLEITTCERYAGCYDRLFRATYGTNAGLWTHPYPKGSRLWAHVDRVGCRLPEQETKRQLQRSLTPHLDCCPDALHAGGGKEWPRWRPIQCLVALTPTLEPNEGGFECLPGFHASEFQSHYHDRKLLLNDDKKLPCVGDYIAVSEPSLVARFEHVPIPAGAALFWDQRLPHANSRRNDSGPRMCVYGGFLPRGPALNDAYAAEQRRRLLLAQAQPDFWMGRTSEPLASPGPAQIKAAISKLPGHARDLLGFSSDDDDILT